MSLVHIVSNPCPYRVPIYPPYPLEIWTWPHRQRGRTDWRLRRRCPVSSPSSHATCKMTAQTAPAQTQTKERCRLWVRNKYKSLV